MTQPEYDKSDAADKLKTIEAELLELVKKKSQADRQLANIESRLYAYETSYLDDSQTNGNILRGFDHLVQGRPERRQKKQVLDADRIFSMSSATLQQSLELNAQASDGVSIPGTPSFGSHSRSSTAGTTTPQSLKKRTSTSGLTSSGGGTNYAHMHAFGLGGNGGGGGGSQAPNISQSVPSTPNAGPAIGHKQRTRTSDRPQKRARTYNDDFET
ncbi:chromatin modification- protein eaf6 [Sorochytrium milnesiophthora]